MPVLLLQLVPIVVLLLLGFSVGRVAERRHLRRLARREQELAGMLVTNLKSFPGGPVVPHKARLVMGQAVIATDYLKKFLAGIRNLLGGELGSYRSLMNRARREAVVRMLEQARDLGYNAVCNVRLNSADIGGASTRRRVPMVEMLATGTAYSLSEDAGG